MTTHPPLAVKDQVYEELRQRIMQLVLKPGQGLSEKEIAELLQVSRTPVREAFIKLAGDDLVRILPQRGTFVSKISIRAVRQAGFVREALEVAVMKKAIAALQPEDEERLLRIVEQQTACGPDAPSAFYQLDEQFHQTLGAISGFPAAWDVVRSVKLQMDRGRYLSLPLERRQTTIVEQHRAIVEALIARDGERAC
ncbi:MAG: GntR family transcriptional regulator, partial [Cohnella sp.]|nr:GntR family transcriptional regulator [Cohnella sp.]